MRHFLKYDLVPILSMAILCAFPCVFLYAQNIEEARPSAMVPFLIIYSVTALILFLVTLIPMRNASRAAFWTDLAMLVVINFNLVATRLKELAPVLRERYFFLLVLVLLLALLVLLLRKKPDMRTGCLLVAIGFGSVMLINVILAVPRAIHAYRAAQELAQQEESPYDLSGIRFTTEDRPNVYLYMFDEYGGYENLLHYYDFDNGPFLSELEDQGFTVAYESRNTEALFTDTLVTNIINLDYVVKALDPLPIKRKYQNNCQMFRMFAANGYQLNLVNHVDFIGTEGCRVLTSRQTRQTISVYLLRNSLYNKSFWLRQKLNEIFRIDYAADYRASLDNAMEAGLDCWKEVGEGPTFTLVYIQCPHSPTMVGPNGEALPYATGWNWRDHSLYLGQLEYVSKYIRNVVAELQAHDPDALILLMSDHGNRFPLHMWQVHEVESYVPEEENPYMLNFLSCVYYRGQSFEIEGLTGINTLRSVFSQVFGADLPPIEPVVDYSDQYLKEEEG